MAARIRTLPAAIAPVLVGTALAGWQHVCHPLRFVAALIGAIFPQVGTNLSNDYSDARRGADADVVHLHIAPLDAPPSELLGNTRAGRWFRPKPSRRGIEWGEMQVGGGALHQLAPQQLARLASREPWHELERLGDLEPRHRVNAPELGCAPAWRSLSRCDRAWR